MMPQRACVHQSPSVDAFVLYVQSMALTAYLRHVTEAGVKAVTVTETMVCRMHLA